MNWRANFAPSRQPGYEGALRLHRCPRITIGCGDFQVTLLAAEHPARTPVDDRLVQASVAVARILLSADPIIYPLVPGSGPMYALCQRWGIPSCAAPGVSHPAANIHAPNENIFVDDYIRTIKGIGLLMAEYGRRE